MIKLELNSEENRVEAIRDLLDVSDSLLETMTRQVAIKAKSPILAHLEDSLKYIRQMRLALATKLRVAELSIGTQKDPSDPGAFKRNNS